MPHSFDLRALTEAAAAFAEIPLTPVTVFNADGKGTDQFIGHTGPLNLCPRGWWAPATNSEDAMLLAQRIGMQVDFVPWGARATRAGVSVSSTDAKDPAGAARLAILRCAARHRV